MLLKPLLHARSFKRSAYNASRTIWIFYITHLFKAAMRRTVRRRMKQCENRLGNRSTSYLKQRAANAREVHQHDSRVDPCNSVERVPCEATIPADFGDLVLRGHGCQLSAVEGLQEFPDVIHWPEKQHICVHIQQRVYVFQDDLRFEEAGILNSFQA